MDKKLPHYLVNIILDYDGRIKYKRGKYINVIHKYDFRYDIVKQVIDKKIEIINLTAELDNKVSLAKPTYIHYEAFIFMIMNILLE